MLANDEFDAVLHRNVIHRQEERRRGDSSVTRDGSAHPQLTLPEGASSQDLALLSNDLAPLPSGNILEEQLLSVPTIRASLPMAVTVT